MPFVPCCVLCAVQGLEKMRASCKLAAQVLQHAGSLVKPGITTDEIDQVVHDMIVAAGAYPSPLNYGKFPKSVCTSVNEVMCHGIPDKRCGRCQSEAAAGDHSAHTQLYMASRCLCLHMTCVCDCHTCSGMATIDAPGAAAPCCVLLPHRPLREGDIVNIDVTCYLNGYHGDTSRTFFVGSPTPHAKRLVEANEEALREAIKVTCCGNTAARRQFAVLALPSQRFNCLFLMTAVCSRGEKARLAPHITPSIPVCCVSLRHLDTSIIEACLVAACCVCLCLQICGPGVAVSKIGEVCQQVAQKHKLTVVRDFIGHGVGTVFHAEPQVMHHKNNYPGTMQVCVTRGQHASQSILCCLLRHGGLPYVTSSGLLVWRLCADSNSTCCAAHETLPAEHCQ